MLNRLRQLIIGKPRDAMDRQTRHAIALTAIFAWIGLGADGLSSSCYGPEQAFLALGHHTYLALYLAIAIAVTVFIISFAYNQVIELFPNGGGGYKVATTLLGKYPGLLAGSALIADYVLTITISIASGVDALFSLLPVPWQEFKLEVDSILIFILIILNLRGMKESIKVLMPIFIGFIVSHITLIAYGILRHGTEVPLLFHSAVQDVHTLTINMGALFVIALFVHAYSLGGGTYTGLEAVSNNVNTLADPRVRTGKWTMFYMALSLSLTAGGIILLYLLWNVHPEAGKTLNAIAFRNELYGFAFAHPVMVFTLAMEAGLLFIGANTGFLGGPAVLANLAIDNWVPRRYRNLSSRLVTENGVVLFGVAALVLLLATDGHVAYIVVLYTINVFLAFTTCILGLCKHWWQQRHHSEQWWFRLLISLIGLIVCSSILILVVVSQFFQGGLVALVILGIVVTLCLFIRRHYDEVNKNLAHIDSQLVPVIKVVKTPPPFDPQLPTAVFFVGSSRGTAMHTLLWIQRLFPNYFKNFVFVRVGVIDVQNYGIEKALNTLKKDVEDSLDYFVEFANQHGIAARKISDYATDPTAKLEEIAKHLNDELEQCIFFASKMVFAKDNWLTRRLHNETAFSVQRRLYLDGVMMVILPMKVSIE